MEACDEKGKATEVCANCNESCAKPLRCGVCKIATYCSAKCQREDWRFHKRNCKKAVEPEIAPKRPKSDAGEDDQAALESMKAMEKDNPDLMAQVKKMMGVDEAAKSTPASAAAAEPAQEPCNNCAKPCAKPLRCGTCKAATYCSAACQREDWQFHKRNCKKPEAAKKGDGYPAPQTQENEGPKPAPIRPKASDKEVVADEDVGSWYKHREFKPAEEKKDFIPTAVESEVAGKAPESASAWNAAGTWEEKSMLPWWKEKLASLKTLKMDNFGNTSRYLRVEKVGDVTGEANIMHIRGTPRFFFDLRFDLEFCYGFSTSSRTSQGRVKVLEFTNDVVASGDSFPTQVEAKNDDDKADAEAELVPMIHAALREYVVEYEAQVQSRNTGTFPGQLPPSASSK